MTRPIRFLAFILAAVLPVLASAQPLDREALERAITESVSRGDPASDLQAQWRERYGKEASTSPRAKRVEGQTLKRALDEVKATVRAARAGRGDPQKLAAAVESLRAADALAMAAFDDAQKRLDESGSSGGTFGQRLAEARQRVRSAIDPVYGALDVPRSNEKRAGSAVTTDAALLDRAAAVLEAIPTDTPSAILGASTLPVRPANLPARAPLLIPVVTPVYQSNVSDATPADASAADDAPFNAEILQKAADLGHDYVRVFEFVRNEVRTEWYAGSQKGATGVLRTKSGNAVDQSSLLIALLRASGAPSRYVSGVIEMPVETLAAQMGLADTTLVPDLLARAGIAYSPIVQGGRVARVRLEHTWVASLVPYTNYRGVTLDTTGRTWLPLDAWLKRVEGLSTQPLLLQPSLSAPALAAEYVSTDRTKDLMTFVRERATAVAAGANQTYAQALGEVRIVAQRLDLLPNTLPYDVVVVTRESAAVDPASVVTVRMRLYPAAVGSAAGMDLSYPLRELVNDRVTLSYDAASVDDHRVSLLWGGLDQTPSYLIQVRPRIHVAGHIRGSGTTGFTPGAPVRFEIAFNGPFGTHAVEQTLTAGAYQAMGVAAGGLTRSAVLTGDLERDGPRFLDGAAKKYVTDLKAAEDELALLTGAAIARPLPSLVMVNNYLRADAIANVTFAASWRGVTMDALTRVSEPVGSAAARTAWMQLAALEGSSLEQLVFASLFQVDALSADRVLALAGRVVLSGAVGETQLAGMPHAAAVKTEIGNWLRQGYTVTTHAAPITRNIWTGSAWVVEDPATKAAGYFISGALAGGTSTDAEWVMKIFADALANSSSSEPADPLSAASITIVTETDGQKGTVGKILDKKVQVRVRDAEGRPVKGAKVTFRSLRGGATVAPLEAASNANGIAETEVTLGQSTDESSLYLRKSASDTYTSKVGQNFVTASVVTRSGSLPLTEPINAYAFPDIVDNLFTGWLNRGEGGVSGGSTIIAEDRFGNLVANASLVIAAQQATNPCEGVGTPPPLKMSSGTQCEGSMTYAGCGGGGTLELKTNSEGSATFLAFLPPVNASMFPVTITSGLTLLNLTFRSTASCGDRSPRIIMQHFTVRDAVGRLVRAAKPGTQSTEPVYFSAYVSAPVGSGSTCGTNRDVTPVTTLLTSSATLVPGSVTGPTVVGGGLLSTTVTTGPLPAIHNLSVTFTVANPGGCDGPGSGPLAGGMGVEAIWGVEAKVDRAIPVEVPPGTDTGKLHLNALGRLTYPVEIEYSIKPANYAAALADVNLLAADVVNYSFIGTSTLNTGKIRVESGYPFDISKRNDAQLVLNNGYGGLGEIKSDKYELPFRQKIITEVRAEGGQGGEPVSTKKLKLLMDVDIVNERACRIGATYFFKISRQSRITLKASPRASAGGPPTGTPLKLIDDVVYAEGEHSITLQPEQFLPREFGYQLLLTATSVSDPSLVEENEGHLELVFKMNDALPVGQVLVKGVNVKSGRLVQPGQSLQVQGRGPALAFRPTYSSGGAGSIGALGANWSHNYEASLAITPCGEVVVSTGDAGSMRFFPGPNNTFVPGKGYHGTLVANPTDQTFDFYSKDGTRYHFKFVTFLKRWLLETITDPNGNLLKLDRDLTSPETPLKTVTDGNGRTLNFSYETQDFKARQASVISRVAGPDGIAIEFDYDTDGNLIRSQRADAPALIETYAYSVSESSNLAHLMTAYTNINGQVTGYTYQTQMTPLRLGVAGTPIDFTIPDGKVSRVTAADAGTTTFAYVPSTGSQITTVNDGVGNPTVYTLDRYGSPLTIQTPAGTTTMVWEPADVVMRSKTDANGVVTSYTYDAQGNVLTEAVSGAGVSVTSSNTWLVQAAPPYIKNRPLTRSDRRGNTTGFTYDARGNLTAESRPESVTLGYTYAGNGDRITATDGRGGVTKFSYDANGNLEQVTDPMGGTIATRHDSRGRVRSITDQEARTTVMEYNTLDQMTIRADAKGGRREFTYDALGNKLSEKDEENRTATYEYDAVNRLKKVTNPIASKSMGYDKAGNKTSETDWLGHETTYAYDGANRLITRTEPLQKITRYGYDGVGNVTTETDAENRATAHEYDGLNRRTKTTDAELGVTLFQYDGNGNKTRLTDAEGRVTAHSYDGLNRLKATTADATGVSATTSYTYDKNNNVTIVSDPYIRDTKHEYDANNRKTRTVDQALQPTRFEYDKVGNKLTEVNARGRGKGWTYDELNRVKLAQDEERSQTAFEYDKVGNQVSERWQNGNTIVRDYDALNRLIATRDDLGSLGGKGYDGQGNVTSERDANGNTSTHVYDELNRRTSSTLPSDAGARLLTFGYDKVGNVTSEKDANDNTTTHIYDKLNRRTSSTDSLGRRYAATYDKVGNKRTETDANERTDTHTYDGLNRLTRTVDSIGTVMEATYDLVNKIQEKDANGIATDFDYDDMNRPRSATRSGVTLSANEYDEVGNVRFVTDANGNKVGYEYDGRNLKTADNRSLGAITRYTRDNMGDVTQVLDPEGRKTVNAYDSRRRLDTVTNGAQETTDYSYDLNGNRTGVLKPKGAGFFQTFAYDAANRLVRVTTPAGTSSLGYDRHGNLTSKTDAKNHATAYQYDARHRRTRTIFADTKFEVQTFDGVGNLKTLTDANLAVTSYTYDARNRETLKAYSASADGLQSIGTGYDGNGNVLSTTETYVSGTRAHTRAYDRFNRLQSETDPWGDTITHLYDTQGNRKSTTAQGSTTLYGYDSLNRRISTTASGGAIQTTYDRTNLPTEIRYPNGVVSTTTYDAAMRTKSVAHAKGATSLESTTYSYDTNGNRTLQTKVAGALTEATTYLYDNDDWLKQTSVTKSQGATTGTQLIVYTLDAVGNRSIENSTGTGAASSLTYEKTYTLDPRDRVTQVVVTGTGSGTTTYTYDDNGNLLTKANSAGTRTFVWNIRDRLVEVKNAGSTIARYRYNAEGLRDEIEGQRRTTWVNGFAYLDKSITNSLLAKYETHANGRSPIVAITGSGNEYLHSDALGSSTLSTNGAGGQNAITSFDAWGNSATSGSTINKFGYTGHEMDGDTGLVYFKARYYDSELGRFISADPYEGEAPVPVSWNSYLYASGNPLFYIDKQGYAGEPPEIEQRGRVIGGVTRSFNMAKEAATDPNTPWVEKQVNTALALATFPVSVAETLLYSPLNVAAPADEAGQHLARASLQKDPRERNLDLLRAVASGSEAFTNQGAAVGAPRPSLRAVENDIAKKQAANATEVKAIAQREQGQAAGANNASVGTQSASPGTRVLTSEGGDGKVAKQLLPTDKTAVPTAPPPRQVLLDSNVTTGLAKDPTLKGRVLADEQPVVSYVTRPEMQNATKHSNLKGVPRALDDIPVLADVPSLDLRINIRGQLPDKAGRFGDGIIGAQALEKRIPLVTNDTDLAKVVRGRGGEVR
ncbi:RHS repeat-associated core domain-containing protein [Usitatibacter rugosus]|nr:RHS repeat-associated core domain-containing protein [Usitatibacter rugosus]